MHGPSSSVSVADKSSQSGHAVLLAAELREFLNSLDMYVLQVSEHVFLCAGQALLINHGTHVATFLYCIHGRHH